MISYLEFRLVAYSLYYLCKYNREYKYEQLLEKALYYCQGHRSGLDHYEIARQALLSVCRDDSQTAAALKYGEKNAPDRSRDVLIVFYRSNSMHYLDKKMKFKIKMMELYNHHFDQIISAGLLLFVIFILNTYLINAYQH